MEVAIPQLAGFDGEQVPRRHPNTLSKRSLRHAVGFDLREEGIERAILQIVSDIRQALYTLH